MSSDKVGGPATDDDQSPVLEFCCFHFLLFSALLLLPLVAAMSDPGVLPAAQQALSPGHPGGLGALSGLCPRMDRVPCICQEDCGALEATELEHFGETVW